MDTSALKARLAASRLAAFTVGSITFHVRRPGKLDFIRLAARGVTSNALEAAIDSVRGWDGVTARDFGDDNDEPVPFDRDLIEPLLTDRADLITGLINGVADLVVAAQEVDAEKKS